MISGTSNKSLFTGPCPSFSSPFYFKKYKKIRNHLRNILSFHISTFWNSKLLTFVDPLDPIFFVSHCRNSPQKILTINRIWGVFSWDNFGQPIILTKWEIISKSKWNQKCFSKSHLSFVHEIGMLWNLDMFGKSDF